MDLTVLPFFETWSAHILGDGRGCAGALTRPSTRHLLPKNFEKTALRKRLGIFTVKMRGGHIYGNYCTSASATTYFISNTAKNIHKWQLHYPTPIFLCDKQLKIKLGHIKLKYCNQFSNGTNLGERINERQEGDWPGASFTVKSTNCF